MDDSWRSVAGFYLVALTLVILAAYTCGVLTGLAMNGGV